MKTFRVTVVHDSTGAESYIVKRFNGNDKEALHAAEAHAKRIVNTTIFSYTIKQIKGVKS